MSKRRVHLVCRTPVVLVACLVTLCLLAASAEASFAGRNGHLAFSAETTFNGRAQNATLWDYNPVTDRLRQLTRRAGGCHAGIDADGWVDAGHDYSPDGRWIAYVHADDCPGGEARSGLWMVRADGRKKRKLGSFELSWSAAVFGQATAAFSPDGRAVAVLSWAHDDPRGYYVLRIFNRSDGAVLQELFFDGSGSAAGVDWGTNGRLLMSMDGDLYVASPDGGSQRRLRLPRGGGIWSDETPDWSPSGRTFVFSGAHWDDDFLVGRALWLGSPGQNRPRQLATAGRFPAWPVYSPDGRYIAYVEDEWQIRSYSAKRRGRIKIMMRLRGRIELVRSISWQPRRRAG